MASETFDVRYTEQARNDIFRNACWWAENHSLAQALAWESAVEMQIATLNQMPERHGVAEENEKFEIEIRQMIIGVGSKPRYRAIYTIKEHEVVVLAVRAGSQDTLQSEP